MGLMLAGCLNLRAQQIITLGRNSDFRMVKVTGHVQLEESETKRMVPLPNASVRIYNLTDSVCQILRHPGSHSFRIIKRVMTGLPALDKSELTLKATNLLLRKYPGKLHVDVCSQDKAGFPRHYFF